MEAYPSLAMSELSLVDDEDVLMFSCGDEPWAQNVDRYFHEDAYEDQLAGDAITYVVRGRSDSALKALASFAIGEVSWPKPNSNKKSTAIIFAYFGIARALRRTQTDGVKTSSACADTALSAAIMRWNEAELICLSVDEENEAAVQFWSGYGFVEWGKRRQDGGRRYIRMVAKAAKVRSMIEARREAA